ncbi:MAG TPA: YHS domain-containing protein [Candidatus Polarisedimenticolaceae bacterium]|nr:YHS domain-containing protein [Candidatus Polarisedimenticolaceae bacterium]
MVKDPVCGAILDDNTTRRSTYEGRNYAFCSDACKMKFDQAPDHFVSPAGAGSRMGAHDGRSGI